MEERLRELSAGIELFLVGDWVFRPEAVGYECAQVLHDTYMNLIGHAQPIDAQQQALYIVISGIFAGRTFKEISDGKE